MFIGFLFLLSFFLGATGREVVELQGVNFELALTSYKYVAILFYDSSANGKELEQKLILSAERIESLPTDCEIAKVFSCCKYIVMYLNFCS
jgi:hypothetical protein